MNDDGGKPGPIYDEVLTSDVVVVGTGIAGLTAALGAAPLSVSLVTKSRFGVGGSSAWAQGGVAVAVGKDDRPDLHAADTMAAGAGLNDAPVVALLTTEGPRRIRQLLRLGAKFDRNSRGQLELGREAAHSRRRILHAHGDATGAEMLRTLSEAVRRAPEVAVHERTFALDLVRDASGRVTGLLARHPDGRVILHQASSVVIATGGLGRLFLHTTNPVEATADGLAIAARAGVLLEDLEFVQFHPTALAVGADPMPLLTEALRGEGALLVNAAGRRIMEGVHPDLELAPRDIVARAIWRCLAAGEQVFLDARSAVGERFPERFPTVFSLCQEHGLDPRRAPMPVAPAAHYHMGGIAVDANGRCSLPGLWACGEVASTGVHGANRLASNSLLEALVFGARVAEELRREHSASSKSRNVEPLNVPRPPLGLDPTREAAIIQEVRTLMWNEVGLVRTEAGISHTLARLDELAAENHDLNGEARNLLCAGRLVASAALARKESRGGHYRSDFDHPETNWQRHLTVRLASDGDIEVELGEEPQGLVAAVGGGAR